MTDREKELERLLRKLFIPFDAMVSSSAFPELRAEVRAFLASSPAQDSVMESARAAIVLERCDCGDCHICRPAGRKP